MLPRCCLEMERAAGPPYSQTIGRLQETNLASTLGRERPAAHGVLRDVSGEAVSLRAAVSAAMSTRNRVASDFVLRARMLARHLLLRESGGNLDR